MTTHAAFLRAILADPDDDTSRLVFADWLDEHGDPVRAEFIRVQCELARMPAARPLVTLTEAQHDRPMSPDMIAEANELGEMYPPVEDYDA